MKKLLSFLLVTGLCWCSLFYWTSGLAQEAIGEDTKSTFESLVLDIIKKNPEVIKQALEDYEKEVAKKQEEEEFKKQLEDRAEVSIGDSPVRGEKKAQYTLIAFSDFQCPFCKRGDDTAKQFLKNHEKEVKYVFKNFPLSFHPQAMPAAKAAWAAGKQGKFYEYHDKLFEDQGKLGEEQYVQIAKDLKLNLERFNKDRSSEEAEKEVNAEMKQGQDIGISGTPGFLLNGVKILGAYPLDHFEKVFMHLENEKTAQNK